MTETLLIRCPHCGFLSEPVLLPVERPVPNNPAHQEGEHTCPQCQTTKAFHEYELLYSSVEDES